MQRSVLVVLVLVSPLAACGSGELTATSATSTTPAAVSLPPTTAPPATSAPAPESDTPPPAPASEAPPSTTSPVTAAATELMELTVASPTEAGGGCPHGRWTIDPNELSLVQLLASGEITSNGSILVDFDNGAYTITASGLALELVLDDTSFSIEVDGATTGTYSVGADELTLVSTSFDMDAAVAVNGEPDADGFVVDMFRAIFGSATVPYECVADGTLVVTYTTPTGPVPTVHRPA